VNTSVVGEDSIVKRIAGENGPARPVELDLSENNPTIGVPAAVLSAMRQAAKDGGGPDPAGDFIRAAAARDGVPPDWILPGNGSLELIHHVCRAFLRPGSRASVLGPTFGEFALAARNAGAVTVEFLADEADDFRLDPGAAIRMVSVVKPAVLFLCNPNNPTGEYLGKDAVGRIRDALGDGLLVLDEAYGDFVEERWAIPPEWFDRDRLIVLRSVSKVCAMQYLGAGYAVASPALLAPIAAARQPGAMNPVTAAGGAVYLRDPGIAAGIRVATREGMRILTGGLRNLGFRVVPGAANYVMVRVGDARRARWDLMHAGVLVKDLESYGLPEYLRVAAPAPGEVPRVVRAFSGLPAGSAP